jgi:hypothetical protein
MRRLAFLTLAPLGGVLVLALGLAACGGDDDGASATPVSSTVAPAGTDPAIDGVQLYTIGKYTHVKIGARVVYDRHPPVGGTHWVAPGWAECGFYDQPIPDEPVVHDLEHGAVWVAYQPGLAAADLEILRQLVRTDGHLLVTPYPDLRAPLVATAWGAQLDLPSAGDGRLVQFIARYTNADTAPEAGATCGDGEGVDAKPVDLD